MRRQSLDPEDLILAHVGGMDTCARGLKAAAALLESGELEAARKARYAGWATPEAQKMLAAGTLDSITADVLRKGPIPSPSRASRNALKTCGTATSDERTAT